MHASPQQRKSIRIQAEGFASCTGIHASVPDAYAPLGAFQTPRGAWPPRYLGRYSNFVRRSSHDLQAVDEHYSDTYRDHSSDWTSF